MATETNLRKVKVSAMNAVHDLAVLVARDEGLFQKEGLDVEILNTPGTSHLDADRQALKKDIFDRPMESIYNDGGVDQYRMCEWRLAPPCPRWPSLQVQIATSMSLSN